ncbi:MAG: SMC-Scp complex subunit ScpB [Saprospiraceae bacterium]|nr:SMC-Scp complex subunit ScpB [Saprospiraceae bacterium]
MEKINQHIEALIFATDGPVNREEIQQCLETVFETSIAEDDIEKAITSLKEKYSQDDFAFEISEIAGGLSFLSKGAFYNTIATHLKLTTRKRLSQAAMETLSIIAYKQPITKTDMENIRGVSCDYSVQKLLEKELVTILGRSDGPGKPLLYGTSDKFMDYFGIHSLEELPKLKDFKEPENSIGEQAPIEETTGSPEAEKTTTEDEG